MIVASYARMSAFEEGALHRHYEDSTGETAVWYVFGLLLRTSGVLDEAAFKLYANRWDVCPTGVTREAFLFGYYHAKEE